MKNPHVLFLVTKGDWGGAQKYVHDLALSLQEQCTIEVATGSTGRMTALLQKARVPVHILHSIQRDISIAKELRALVEIWKLIGDQRPDVVHLNSSKMGLAAVAARLRGVNKIIFTVHGWPFLEDRRLLVLAVMKFFSWLTALVSTHVIVISRTDEQLAKRMCLIGKKVSLIRNGIEEPALIEEPRKKLSKEIGVKLEDDERIIGTIGEYTKNKGHLYLIKAFAALKEQDLADRLIIAGRGELRVAYEALINDLNLSDAVILTGFMPNAAQYIRAFNILTLPSVKEGLPYVLLEAGMQGMPIVASDVGGIRELLTFREGVQGILVPAKDEKALAEALAASLKKPAPAQQELFKKRFAKDAMVRKTRALY